jgi:hypothetical protein
MIMYGELGTSEGKAVVAYFNIAHCTDIHVAGFRKMAKI